MAIKFSVFIATTVDGFIARIDGSLDWLPGSDGQDIGIDTGYQDFFDSVDTLVMGRNSYELVLSFGAWPYGGKRVVVLSSRYADTLQPLSENVWGSPATPTRLATQLADMGAQHVYVDGGKTIQSFLRAGLMDEMTITRIPVLIGSGISLFGDLPHDIDLQLLSSHSFANGMEQNKYRLIR